MTDNGSSTRRKQITVDLTAKDTEDLDKIVAYYAEGRFGIAISREDAVASRYASSPSGAKSRQVNEVIVDRLANQSFFVDQLLCSLGVQ